LSIAESRQAVHHPSAGFQAGIEDGDGIAAPGKGVGRHQTADAGANHGHALAAGVFHRGFGQAVFPAVVQQEPREGADRHGSDFPARMQACSHTRPPTQTWDASSGMLWVTKKKFGGFLELAVG
jgi:hypothetical protein